jgi:CRISPR-associated endonuclease/helicase Cas3
VDYIAHVKRLENGEWDEPQSLTEHLEETAKLAAKFAADFDSSEWAYAAGIAHDAGKGTVEWQRYIRDKSGFGYDDEASSETVAGKIEHSGASAKLVEEVFGGAGRFISYCIAGHHTGLPDFDGCQSSLSLRLQQVKTEEIDQKFKTALLSLCPKRLPWQFNLEGLDISLWIRMLFSCLIDADRLNTESYMNPETSKMRSEYLPIAELIGKFNLYMSVKIQDSAQNSTDHVYKARQQVLADCRGAATMEPGFFSLTVPTGGGKTLSSMAFALNHAEKHGKKRIIYVIPYTSIIEQNAGEFRNIFGSDEIVEHHANLDDKDSTWRSRLATENWDAPIVVTTNVQFFESLFAAKTSRCRKLHNIANSVVILDEAQLVPVEFLEPILNALRLLTEHYKTSVVISTATQPFFEKRGNFQCFKGLECGTTREIVRDVAGLFRDLERVKIEYPTKKTATSDWKDLANELSAYNQALCVVSDRKSCRELHSKMPNGTYHLSALMCAAHRSDIIKEIKDKLKSGDIVRVISTQLIEAGVDIDFPVVYRAMAGLDSIAQAAGRCNREGKLNAKGKLGKVVIFNGIRKAPPGILRKACDVACRMIDGGMGNLMSHSAFDAYFSEFYRAANSLDNESIINALAPEAPSLRIQFRKAAEAFKIIDDSAQRAVLIRYKEGDALIDLLKTAKKTCKGFEVKLLRQLQRYTVNVYTNQFSVLNNRESLEEIIDGVYALKCSVEYSKQTGLLIDDMSCDPLDYFDNG